MMMIRVDLYGRYHDPVEVYFQSVTMALDWVNWMLIQRGANPMEFEFNGSDKVVHKEDGFVVAEFSNSFFR